MVDFATPEARATSSIRNAANPLTASSSSVAAMTRGSTCGSRGRPATPVLAGYGAHAVGHLAVSALAREYTAGAVTSPTVVLPYWWWARRTLSAEGVEPRPVWAGLAGTYPVILAALGLGRLRTRRRDSGAALL